MQKRKVAQCCFKKTKQSFEETVIQSNVDKEFKFIFNHVEVKLL